MILAHNYQRDEVQEIADFVGDSLGLSQQAAATPADVIVFCGVHFMAETAAILCPQKIVLLPDLRAGCSLAATITADELRAWKARYPDAVVVAYVNTSAEVKAESDYCCTSANAAKIVRAIPAERPILFVPDKFLAAFVARETGRPNIIAYPGSCHVHRAIRPGASAEHDGRTSGHRIADSSGVRLRRFLHGARRGRHAAAFAHIFSFDRRHDAPHRRIEGGRNLPSAPK